MKFLPTGLKLALVLLAVATAPWTAVAEQEDDASAAAASERPIRDFAKGTWVAHTYGGYFNELGPNDQEGGFASVGASYHFVDNMSLGLEVSGYGISQPGPEAVAVAPGIVFRHHLFHTRRGSFFLDVTAAVVQASEQVPQGGTKFNFIEQAGMGITCDLRGNAHLLLGVRYLHLSNAQIEGDDRNPSINGVTAYVGLLFRL